MAKKSFNSFGLGEIAGRVIKVGMVVLLIPALVGMSGTVLRHLNTFVLHQKTAGHWLVAGFLTYVGVHLILFRPRPVFHASHRTFAVLAAWLFGGHVTSVEDGGSTLGRRRRKRSTDEDGETVSTAAGSPLVAFSPYVVPFYTLLVCALTALARRWVPQASLEIPACFVIGVTVAFHWIMTADDLQEQRDQWHAETYLLAVALVFLITLVISVLCLPWALPDFPAVKVLGDGVERSRAIYSLIHSQLFG